MIKTNAKAYAVLIKTLQEGWHSLRDLADETGLHYITVMNHIGALRKEKLVHIHALDTDSLGRESIPQFVFGPGKDKPRRKLTGAERQQRHRNKKAAQRTNLVMAGRGQFTKSANGGYRFEQCS